MTVTDIDADALPYYSFDKVMSYNAPWNFVCGARGLGKTYGSTRDAVKAFTRTGEQFIYLRRFSTELDESKDSFFDSIGEEFPDWDFRVVGRYGEASRRDERDSEKREWHKVVHFIALTSAQSLKSKDYRFVTRIIFDEFILEKGFNTYIKGPEEARIFQNFYNTIDRYKNKTKVFFLSNSVSMMNPYFLRYNIDPSEGREFVLRGKNKFALAHFVNAEDFSNAVRATEFGQFVEEFDPEYASYAIDNEFSDAHDSLVGAKSPTARYLWSLETTQGTFSVWKESLEARYYAQMKRPKRETVFTLIPNNVSDHKSLVIMSDEIMRKLRTAWRTGRIYFDQQTTRNMFTEVFK